MATMLDQLTESLVYQLAHTEDTRVNRIVGSAIFCLVIAYISVLLRFIARRIGRSSLQADDWWMLASLVSKEVCRKLGCKLMSDLKQVFTTTYFGLLLAMVPLGFGRHEVLSLDQNHLRKFMIVWHLVGYSVVYLSNECTLGWPSIRDHILCCLFGG